MGYFNQRGYGVASKERILSKVLTEFILERESLADALGWRLAARLVKSSVPESDIRELDQKMHLRKISKCFEVLSSDLFAVTRGTQPVMILSVPFMYFKGFQALCCYRVANFLWQK